MTAVPPAPHSITPGASTGTSPGTGPVRLGPGAHAALRPDVRATIDGGFWAERRGVNAEVSIPQGPDRLAESGAIENLRRAASRSTGGFEGMPFQDSDLHKWLEAAAWQLGDPALPPARAAELAARVSEFAELLAAAQEDSGYLNSYYQVAKPDVPHFTELHWGHELYTAGHLIQAAVAHHRTTGSGELLDVARRFADHIEASSLDSVCGHPEIETALVELARETGERRYTELARGFIDRHGGGLPPLDRPGIGRPGYFQDHAPVREVTAVTGHSVRQLYLLAGAADVATETGEPELRAAVERLWTEMTARQTYLTGGIGAHHKDEAFGHPYELPNDRAYTETCAAIASVQFSWRMALLTGEAKYGDLIERTLYNGVLCGVSLSGDRYLYDNPLHVRDGHAEQEGATERRVPWFRCACCPPNLMRLFASLPHYLASVSPDGGELQIHQYATGTLATGPTGAHAERAVTVETDYPWDGRVAVTVDRTGDTPWTLALRVPHWAADGGWTLNGAENASFGDGWLRVTRTWTAGETVVLDLALAPRLTLADPRVDAARGCVAIERGPLVHCVESLDHPGLALDDLVLDTGAPLATAPRPDLLGGVTVVTATARTRARPEAGGWWPYRPAADGTPAPAGDPVTLTAIPYYAWANRDSGAMRVWLPTDA
ncbi:glycoside hydrolase family 127 protein [Streptomyces sp. SBT349]|uniref:glycoside hydrolase family 127 protein n=1 Tax=Streptomyces sp. SBT349 TaxID=1580539 RepID=UPI00099BB3A9|nr:beta-L-arabinofuranosidase domain-containing protein [Streptomyces sp. SBT349]